MTALLSEQQGISWCCSVARPQNRGTSLININSINLLILILTVSPGGIGGKAASWQSAIPSPEPCPASVTWLRGILRTVGFQRVRHSRSPCKTNSYSQRACTEQLEKGREDKTVRSYRIGDQKDESYGTLPALSHRSALFK